MGDKERTEAMKKVIKAIQHLTLYEALGVLDCASKVLFLSNQKAIKKYWIDDFQIKFGEAKKKNE